MIEYRVFDRRDGREGERSVQADTSAKSENAAIRASGIPAVFAEIVFGKLPDEVARLNGGGGAEPGGLDT